MFATHFHHFVYSLKAPVFRTVQSEAYRSKRFHLASLPIAGSSLRFAFALLLFSIAITIGVASASAQVAPAQPAPAFERVCATPTSSGQLACRALRRAKGAQPQQDAAPLDTVGQANGFGPADLQSAYNLDATQGVGKTVAIVMAMDDPNAERDLNTYRATFGLPACTTANGCFLKVNQAGSVSPLPAADINFAGEISLDLDLVSAVCPNCKILLVEADSPSFSDLGTAVNTAALMGATAISNSYGGPEDSTSNSLCEQYYKHPGVAVTVSAGDDGYGVPDFPASCQYVTAVGGTTLKASGTTARGWTETVWNDAEGATSSGCSSFIPKPAFQTDPGCANRTVADVAVVGDPQTGVLAYDTYGGELGLGGWAEIGGTSIGPQIIAAAYALAATAGINDYPVSYPYATPGGLFDITSGSNGTCDVSYLCTAGTGYDGPSGLGTPDGLSAFGPPASTTVQVTVGTNPEGLAFVVDGTTYTSTQTVTWANGSSHNISTTSTQTPTPGTQDTFSIWSDGGSISHSVIASASVTSYSASFATSYLLTTAANPSNGGTVSPASGSYYPASAVVRLTETPNAGFTFSSWTGNVVIVAGAPTVTMSGPQSVTANFQTIVQGHGDTPTINWQTPNPITYGTALSGKQLNATASFNGGSVGGTFVYTPSSGTILEGGSQTLFVTFTPTNTSKYSMAIAVVTLQVNPAAPKITWTKPSTITYGTALSTSQLDATSSAAGNLVYTPPAGSLLTGGIQTLSVTFTPADAADYTAATDTVTITVKQASPIINWPTPAAITYGTALSAMQLNATASIPGTFVYSPAAGTIPAGGAAKLSVKFMPTDTTDYATATTSVTLQVNPVKPTINWPTPAAIAYETALTGTQLNATATNNGSNVAGSFVYTPSKGTLLTVGAQTLSVTFTPSNASDFSQATATVTLQVNPATPKITWAKPAAITYGTALGDLQLDATASVPGVFVYTPAAGTVLGGGTNTLSLTFTPADGFDYTTANDSVNITVNPAVSTTVITSTAPNPASIGQSVTVSFTVTGNGAPTGTVTITSSTGKTCSGTLAASAGSCTLIFDAGGSPKLTAVYAGDSNFKSSTSAKVTQTVQP